MTATTAPGSAPAPAPDAPKKKKTFGETLVQIALAVLFTVIFIFVLNALLGMLFPGIADTFRITATGMQSAAVALVQLNVSLGALMQSLFSILVRVLLIFVIFVISFKLARAIMEWVKK